MMKSGGLGTLKCVDAWGTDFRGDMGGLGSVPLLIVQGSEDRILPRPTPAAAFPRLSPRRIPRDRRRPAQHRLDPRRSAPRHRGPGLMADRDRLAHLQGLPDLTAAARGKDLRDFRHDPESTGGRRRSRIGTATAKQHGSVLHPPHDQACSLPMMRVLRGPGLDEFGHDPAMLADLPVPG
jgi:hypothetical protein